MNWLFLSLLAPAILTVVNFLDKYVVEHKVKDSRGMPVYGSIAALAFGTLVWLLAGLPLLSARNGLLLLVSGAVFIWGAALYFYALAHNQTSYIIAMLQLIPVFVLMLSVLVLGETLSLLQAAGFLLVFSSVLALSIDKVERRVKINKAFWAAVGADIAFAIALVIVKFTVDLEGFAPILVFESWGIALGGLILFLLLPTVRRAFLKSLKTVGRPVLSIMFFNEALFIISKAVSFLAITMAPVALVSVLAGTQVFYAILYGVILTTLFPKLFNEETAKKEIAKKAAFSIILFAGVWFIGVA